MSGGGSDAALEAAMAALRRQYVERLPEKRDVFVAALATVRGGTADVHALKDAITALRFHAHKLAGSAPTYGLPVVGETARTLEEACDAALSNDAAPTAAACTTIGQAADALLAQPEFAATGARH